MDVVFVLDASSSIGSQFMNVLMFVGEMVSRFNIGPGDTEVGVVRFSTGSAVDIALAMFSNKGELVPAILGLSTAASGTTNTASGINEGRNQLSGPNGRTGANRVMVVITDGMSNEGATTITAANAAKNEGTEMIAIGVGSGVNETELNIIATDSNHVFRPTSFDVGELSRFVDSITIRSCAGIYVQLVTPVEYFFYILIHRSSLPTATGLCLCS